MAAQALGKARAAAIWLCLALVVGVPFFAAASSPLLAWRDPVYILAGLSGIAGLTLMLFQPLLATGLLPGLTPVASRRVHRACGAALVAAIAVHVLGLWLTSPPDVVDALLLRSPTPFSLWGVIAMWAVFAAAALVAARRRLRLRWATWRLAHVSLVTAGVATTVFHALLIEGTMEIRSKWMLCGFVLLALGVAFRALWRRRAGRAALAAAPVAATRGRRGDRQGR